MESVFGLLEKLGRGGSPAGTQATFEGFNPVRTCRSAQYAGPRDSPAATGPKGGKQERRVDAADA